MTLSPDQKKLERLEKENVRLKRAIEELSVLNEISTAINSTMTKDAIVDLVVQKCMRHLKVEQAAVQLLDPKEEEEAQQLKTMVRHVDISDSQILPFRLNTELTGWMLIHQEPLLVNDFAADERFGKYIDNDLSIKSLLSVPLVIKGHMIGLLTAFNKHADNGFDREDQRLLSIIATQSAHVIENARLLEEEKALMRIREEVRMAHDIQSNLLPAEAPQIEGYDIAGFSIPAREVGGDLFDFIPLNEEELAFSLGDVTGKGFPAAMLMANTHAAIRSQTLALDKIDLSIGRANNLMCQSTGSGKFVTLFFGVFNSEKHTLNFCNAGHDDPILISPEGEISRLKTGGIVLGFMPNYQFSEEEIPISKGTRLVISSDGITEAMNDKEEEFGEERLQELILENRNKSSQELIDLVFAAVKLHSTGVPQSDDMTMVVVTRE